MIPMDGSSPREFDGVDFTAYFQGPAVYDGEAVSSRAMDVLEEYLTEKGLACRRCFRSGLGAAAGGPGFYEILVWVQENWEFLAGVAASVLAVVTRLRDLWRQLKRKLEDRVLDPYKPSVVVDLGARTQGDGEEGRKEAIRSFRSLLTHVPEINERLRCELPDQKFNIRVLSSEYSSPYAYFAVPKVKRSDVAKMVLYLENDEVPDGSVSAVRLYRQFGFLTRLESSNNGGDFMRMTMR
jgi:hypothetical protein